MQKNKKKAVINLILEILFLLFTAAVYGYFSYFKTSDIYVSLRNSILSLLLFESAFLFYKKQITDNALWINNAERVTAYRIVVVLMFILSVAFSFFPYVAWMYLPVYLLISTFSNKINAIVQGTVYVFLTLILSGEPVIALATYFLGGILISVLFDYTKKEFNGFLISLLPIILTGTMFLLEILIGAKNELTSEKVLLVIINLIASEIFVLIIFYFYTKKYWYKYVDKYLELNNWNTETLKDVQRDNPTLYSKIMHTMHMCEIIGNALGYDCDALKCGSIFSLIYDNPEKISEKYDFPPSTMDILNDYFNNKKAQKKETAVLICSEKIISKIIEEKNSKAQIDYNSLIDTEFELLHSQKILENNEISYNDITQIKKIFKENKLYYDFIR